jgi:diguanylate cyclase (GGDEF)-like protein
MRVPASIGAWAQPATVVDALQTCGYLDQMFRARPELTAVAVTDGYRLGLIMRIRFNLIMSGPYGYGRAIWARRPISLLTDWWPVVLPAATTVVAAGHQIRRRGPDRRDDDVLVHLGGGVGQVAAARLFDALAAQFAERAVRDELTGLANRTHFLDLLATACTTANRDDEQVVLVAFIDLDGMKRVNDAHGHRAGDDVLRLVGRQITDAVRPGEVAARLGGDEFAVLASAPRTHSAQLAAELGQRYLLAVTARDGHAARALHVSASVGVAVSGTRSDAQTLVSEADMAMYKAKQAGGGQVDITYAVESALAQDVDLVDRSVLQALHHGELRVHYQPIVRIEDGRVVAVEALARWQHPSRGLLTAGRFLPGARRSGQLPAVDQWMLGQATRDMAGLVNRLGEDAPGYLNFNLSAQTLAGDFDTFVESTLAAARLHPERVRLELPEDADLPSLAVVAPRLERLAQAGVRLTLDDMGAGSTNLRYLSALTVHGLKIDKAFVTGMVHNPRDHAVVKLLTDLGHGLGLSVTAEGVEDAEQLAALAELGVQYAQGYHVGRPQPLDVLAEQLTAGHGTAITI